VVKGGGLKAHWKCMNRHCLELEVREKGGRDKQKGNMDGGELSVT